MKSKFTGKAQNTLNRALTYARDLGHTYIGSEHLLLGLLGEEDSAAARLLYARGADFDKVRNAVCELAGLGIPTTVLPSDMTPRTKKIIESSAGVSARYGHGYIGTEHLLLALLEEKDCVAVRLLDSLGIRPADIKNEISAFLESISEISFSASSRGIKRVKDTKSALDGIPTIARYGRNLTALAASGELDPIIGRDDETDRVTQILCRRTKNNPCLIGEPGVGKTAVVEGLAQRIADGNVPDLLDGRRIITLDIPSMIAGAKYRGEFEERMKAVMEEVGKNPNIIIFIDEIHTIIGAGAAEGAVDAANILKPALARSELQVIGATTLTEYRRHIEKDAALERRFQPVMIGEPSPADTVSILRGLRDKYEAHHRLKITDEAITAAVELSVRYINDRFLPDKAIDLIDEAAAGVRIATRSTPSAQKELENRLQEVLHDKEEAIGNQDFERAAALRDEEKQLRAEYEKMQSSFKAGENESADSVSVGKSEIADTVTRWTGIPVSRLASGDGTRLTDLGKRIKSRLLGQDRAVDAVVSAILRGRAGLRSPDRPLGSFIFLGPSGVGKTELCRVLADELFGSQSFMIRLDMSEYMEKHSVSRLIGSPPGYVGYDEGGQLTERVRRRPYSVVLLDEIEKAHPEIFNILLQVLEDGILTDAQGRKVDFRNTIIIMTSNIGSQYRESRLSLGFAADGEARIADAGNRMRRALRDAFRPEFLDRVDEVLVFDPLSPESVRSICRMLIQQLAERTGAAAIALDVDESALALLCREGSDNNVGVRPLRRAISRLLEVPLANAMFSGEITGGSSITATASETGEKIIFLQKNPD